MYHQIMHFLHVLSLFIHHYRGARGCSKPELQCHRVVLWVSLVSAEYASHIVECVLLLHSVATRALTTT